MVRKNICYHIGSPANALAINKADNQVAVAGRNVFKIFQIEDENNLFIESLNLRVGKNLNHNFSSSDVVWNAIDNNILATAATNGAVIIWNIQKMSRSKIDMVFQDHKRTVNKVCFHPQDSNVLLSGSQDGTVKLFDLRKKECSSTFLGQSESVRDVQFEPHTYFVFSAVQENGNVQIWDFRRSDRYSKQFTAHNGPVFACDWHPEERKWFATAGRDKTIKVWNLHTRASLEYTIQTIASVSRIKWRPQRRYNIGSCSLVVDFSVYVWDILRPFMPFVVFNEHKDVTTGFAWRNDPQAAVSVGKDSYLYQHVFSNAYRPSDHANPMGLDISNTGDCFFSCSDVKLKPTSINPSSSSNSASTNLKNFFFNSSSSLSSTSKLNIFKKQPDLSKQFRISTSTSMWFQNKNIEKNLSMDWFEIFAKEYKLSGNLAELCEANARLCDKLNRTHIATTWRMLSVIFSTSKNEVKSSENLKHGSPNHESSSHTKNDVKKPDRHLSKSSTGLRSFSFNSDDESDGSTIMSILSPTRTQKNVNQIQSDFFFGDCITQTAPFDFNPMESCEALNQFDADNTDWDLPREAFSLRHPIQECVVPPDFESYGNENEVWPNLDEEDATLEDASILLNEGNIVYDMSESLLTSSVSLVPVFDFLPLVAEMLFYYANLSDVQTCVSMLICIGKRISEIRPFIDDSTMENWFHSYIELLSRFQLWNVSNLVIKMSPLEAIYSLNHNSTSIQSICGLCKKVINSYTDWKCKKCNTLPTQCSVCLKLVKGLYVWCQGCAHGGHFKHIQDWFLNNKLCPAGCGHHCEYT